MGQTEREVVEQVVDAILGRILVGDGIADDTDALQAAFRGERIRLADGTVVQPDEPLYLHNMHFNISGPGPLDLTCTPRPVTITSCVFTFGPATRVGSGSQNFYLQRHDSLVLTANLTITN